MNIVSDSQMSGFIVSNNNFFIKFVDKSVKTYTPNVLQNQLGHNLPDALAMFDDRVNNKLKFFYMGDNGRKQAKYLLIFEKQDWVSELIRNGFLDSHDAIILCSKGRPGRNVNALVKLLHDAFPGMIIVAFGDPNPFGVHIIETYYYAETFKAEFSVPVCWGGLFPSEIGEGNGMEYTASSFSNADKRMDGTARNHCWVEASRDGIGILNQINIMRDKGTKWDMNAYIPTNGTITEYVTKILAEKKYLLGPTKGMSNQQVV